MPTNRDLLGACGGLVDYPIVAFELVYFGYFGFRIRIGPIFKRDSGFDPVVMISLY